MGNNEFITTEVEKKLIQTERAMHDAVLVPIEPLLSDLSSLAGQYRKAKIGLVSLALARRSSELVMQQLLRAKPTNMNLKEAKPLPQFLTGQSTFGAAQQSTGPSSTTAATAMTASSNARRTLLSDDNSDTDMEIRTGSTVPSVRPAAPQSYDQPSSATTSATLVQGSTVGTNRASTMAGSSNAPVVSYVRHGRGGNPVPQSTLPSAFPMSMLQSTTSSIGPQVEDMVRDYYRHRLLRFEYAGSGGLTLNENEYPEEFLPIESKNENLRRRGELERNRRGRASEQSVGMNRNYEKLGARRAVLMDKEKAMVMVMKNVLLDEYNMAKDKGARKSLTWKGFALGTSTCQEDTTQRCTKVSRSMVWNQEDRGCPSKGTLYRWTPPTLTTSWLEGTEAAVCQR
ncbi:hypothetical protein KI688_000632 [Linnemannia hyalina]|uniref:Uncharacterized protein n=1 Tax=Linnemannia hyalina TaxID=64524 RepID=A0A9P8C015_9FUNG|nr:hypothetical protein KI688_000632 [Linnemannia hyalina]